jgi:hypothetical protein
MRKGPAIGGALAVVAVVVVAVILHRSPGRPRAAGPSATAVERAVDASPSGLATPTPEAQEAKKKKYERWRADPVELASARRQADLVRTKLANRGAGTASAPAPTRDERAEMPSPVGSGNQKDQPLGQYVRRTVRQDFVPLAVSCYEELLASHPGVHGQLLLDVTIVGDRSVGGVVDAVELAPDSALTDERFTTCMRESMMAVVFDAPPAGKGRVTFKYPLELAP